jgi:broad specificity phosphatase PhoE
MEHLILARHGESALSVSGTMNGDPRVACPLTERGREQARKLGAALAGGEIDLCVTSEFERARETADLALAGRDLPRLVLPELNDIRVGDYEGKPLMDYRAWARAQPPDMDAPGGGESRAATVSRYIRGYRTILGRPERVALVVAHGLPIRYVLNAAAGDDPAPVLEQVPYAKPYRLSRAELERALARLSDWAQAPRWASA